MPKSQCKQTFSDSVHAFFMYIIAVQAFEKSIFVTRYEDFVIQKQHFIYSLRLKLIALRRISFSFHVFLSANAAKAWYSAAVREFDFDCCIVGNCC